MQLLESLGLPMVTRKPLDKYILLTLNNCAPSGANSNSRGLTEDDESYEIKIATLPFPAIIIRGNTAAGVFWGAQTLLSLDATKGPIAEGIIMDQPRFSYRGVHVDVCRNFHTKEVIKKLIHAMSIYKLNKLHLHLADDEGWRLEIPGLPELTQVSLDCPAT